MNKKKFTIKAIVMDVDGTLTDGGLYISETGELVKRFHVKDGYAIHDLLPQLGIIPIIITGRKSDIVLRRCNELGIVHVVQGSTEKLADLTKILSLEHIELAETAYIGDDINDLECMKKVGVKGCPCDAVDEVKKVVDYITKCSGGNGAVREFIEWLKNTDNWEV